jgi:hypothetical protein
MDAIAPLNRHLSGDRLAGPSKEYEEYFAFFGRANTPQSTSAQRQENPRHLVRFLLD